MYSKLKSSFQILLYILTLVILSACNQSKVCLPSDDVGILSDNSDNGDYEEKIPYSYEVRANGNYNSNQLTTNSADYGKWLSTGLYLRPEDKIKIDVEGTVSMCPSVGLDTDDNRGKPYTVSSRTYTWTDLINVKDGDKLTILVGNHNSSSGAAGNKWSTWNGSKKDDPLPSYPSQICGSNLPCWYTNGIGLYGRIGNGYTTTEVTNRFSIGKEFSTTVSKTGKLRVRIWDCDEKDRCYGDNIGGYTLYVKNIGCPAENGNPMRGSAIIGKLIAGVTTGSGDPNNGAALTYLNINNNDDPTVLSSSFKEGALWLRVHDFPNAYQDDTGTYTVTITIYNKIGLFSKITNSILRIVKARMIDSAKNIFKNIVIQSSFSKAVKATITLYIIIYSIMFLFGMVEISQYDLIVRVTKIAFVLSLFSATSWDFFNNYIFNAFVEGGGYLVNLMTGNIDPMTGNPISTNPFIFADKPFGFLYSNSATFKKIMAFTFMTPIGPVIAIMLIIGSYIYTAAIVKAFVAYLMAYMATALLIALAPIFIPFILFKFTRQLFDTWIRRLFRYMFEPVLLITGLVLLNHMVSITLYNLFNFSICWGCAITIKFSGILSFFGELIGSTTKEALEDISSQMPDFIIFCLQWFMPFSYNNGVADYKGLGLLETLTYTLIYIIIVKLMKGFSDFSRSISITLTNANIQYGAISGSQSPTESATESASEGIKSIFGLDKESKGGRQARNAIQEKVKTEQDKEKNNTPNTNV
jgi:type IV secretion system protein VirB6